MRMLLILALSVISPALIVTGCGGESHSETTLIYAACLDQVVVKKWQEMKGVLPRPIVIDVNALEGGGKHLEDSVSELSLKPATETVTDFLRCNSGFGFFQRFARIQRGFQCSVPIDFIERRRREQLGWKGLYAQYPASCGVITLSKVGLNGSRNEALLAFDWIWDPEAGQVELVLLHKSSDQWRVAAEKIMGVY